MVVTVLFQRPLQVGRNRSELKGMVLRREITFSSGHWHTGTITILLQFKFSIICENYTWNLVFNLKWAYISSCDAGLNTILDLKFGQQYRHDKNVVQIFKICRLKNIDLNLKSYQSSVQFNTSSFSWVKMSANTSNFA